MFNPPDSLPDDLRVLNCAQCRHLMMFPVYAVQARVHRLKVHSGNADGRPLCEGCYAPGHVRRTRIATVEGVS